MFKKDSVYNSEAKEILMAMGILIKDMISGNPNPIDSDKALKIHKHFVFSLKGKERELYLTDVERRSHLEEYKIRNGNSDCDNMDIMQFDAIDIYNAILANKTYSFDKDTGTLVFYGSTTVREKKGRQKTEDGFEYDKESLPNIEDENDL